MPKRYDNAGIAFLYPDNWTVEENDADFGNRSISVTSPNDAFWILSIHPNANDPDRLVDAVVETMREEYDDVEIDKVTLTRGGHDLIGCDMRFFCVDFTNSAQVVAFQDHRASYAIFWQASDQDEGVSPEVFDAITTSFLQELSPKA